MANREFHNRLLVKRAISPTRVTDNTAQVSQIIDTQGFDACEFVILVGTCADVDATFAVTVDYGDAANLSDAASVPAGMLVGTTAAASFQYNSDDQVRKIGYTGDKRYVRLTITPANNTGNADIAATALLTYAATGGIVQPTA